MSENPFKKKEEVPEGLKTEEKGNSKATGQSEVKVPKKLSNVASEGTSQKAPPSLSETTSEQIPGKSPGSSSKVSKKAIDLKRLKKIHENRQIDIGGDKSFVVGFCGGDCAGKKEMISFLFQKEDAGWKMRDSDDKVCILNQDYFCEANKRYASKDTDWDAFYKAAVNLILGNEVTFFSKKYNQDINLKPAKLLIIEGSHIFMESADTIGLFKLINTKIFIDSDSDIRLSRRIYKDTEDNQIPLQDSIKNYLTNIKPSYEKEIEPTKVRSDIIIPHFGGGYDDHKRLHRVEHESNIKNAASFIMAHVKEQMRDYEKKQIEVQNDDLFWK